jgi:hypothetical protein
MHAPEAQRRRFCQIASLVFGGFVPLLAGCNPIGPVATEPVQGRLAVLFTNKGDSLIHVLLSTADSAGKTQEYLVPVGPNGWNSLVLSCATASVYPLGTLITTDPNAAAVSVPFGGTAATQSAGDYGCGSVLSVEVQPSTGRSQPVDMSLRVARRQSAAVADPAASEFVVVEVHGPEHVPASLNLSWEDANGRVYANTLTLSGNESNFGFLLRCPLQRIGLGRLDDPNAAAGTVGNNTLALTMAPLADVACGSLVRVDLVRDTSSAAGYGLALSVEANATALVQMFTDAQAVLETAGVANNPTNALQLFPPPPPGVPAAPQ